MRIALLLGSFNPIHRGHIAIARWAHDTGAADLVWIVPTPQNPLKSAHELAPWSDRVAMIELAVGTWGYIEICTAENELQAPYYTINLIELLHKRHPEHTFSVLCGSDIEVELPRWHRVDELRRMVDFIFYPRDMQSDMQSDMQLYPQNSTAIRAGEDNGWLDPEVLSYIEQHELYFASPVAQARAAFGEGNFPRVINIAIANADNEQLSQMADMAREILDFRHTDLYNP